MLRLVGHCRDDEFPMCDVLFTPRSFLDYLATRPRDERADPWLFVFRGDWLLATGHVVPPDWGRAAAMALAVMHADAVAAVIDATATPKHPGALARRVTLLEWVTAGAVEAWVAPYRIDAAGACRYDPPEPLSTASIDHGPIARFIELYGAIEPVVDGQLGPVLADGMVAEKLGLTLNPWPDRDTWKAHPWAASH